MPELPEVETVRRGLLSSLEGHVVTHVLARRPDLRFPLPEPFRERLEGARVCLRRPPAPLIQRSAQHRSARCARWHLNGRGSG